MSYQGYGNQPSAPPPAGLAGQRTHAAPYPPAQPSGYPPVAQEGYQGRIQQGYPGQGPPQTGGYAPPQPAGAPPVVNAQQLPPPPNTNISSDPFSMATAPAMEKMDEIAGYGGNTFESDFAAPPPSYEQATQPPERRTDQNFRVPVIDEDTARNALVDEVSQHCCWGKGPAKSLTFLDLKSSSAIHYTLETFTESRATKWIHEPYMGQPIDSPAYGPAPMPWDVQVPPPTMFVNNVTKVEVPHTASIKPCHNCLGMGRRRCQSCHGNGTKKCDSCNGTGTQHGQQCMICRGRGRKECLGCHGNGSNECHTCRGKAQLKCYIKLTVTWTNHYEDEVLDGSQLPVQKLRLVNGEVAFQEENPRVWPVTHYPEPRVNAASKQLVTKHSTAYPTKRILMQRHKIRIVPITEVHYKHKDHHGRYLVYGFENKAHITDYPSTCCGCCVIL